MAAVAAMCWGAFVVEYRLIVLLQLCSYGFAKRQSRENIHGKRGAKVRDTPHPRRRQSSYIFVFVRTRFCPVFPASLLSAFSTAGEANTKQYLA